MSTHYHLSQLQCKLLELRVHFHHWWNSGGGRRDPEKHPNILTRRLKNMPLISLRNAEFAAYLISLGIDKDTGLHLGVPISELAKRHERLRQTIKLLGLGRSEPHQKHNETNEKPESWRLDNSYYLRVVEKLDAPPKNEINETADAESDEELVDELATEKPHNLESTPVDEAQQMRDQEEGMVAQQQLDPQGLGHPRRDRSFARFLPFRAKRKKFIKTPPLEQENEPPPPPPSTKPPRKVSISLPTQYLQYDEPDSGSVFGESLLRDIDRPSIGRRAISDVTNASTTVFRPFKAILKRELVENPKPSSRSLRPTSERTSNFAPGKKSTLPGSHLFTTIINDISLNAALQANGLAPRRRIPREVKPDFTNLNDYSSIMNNENKAQKVNRQERPMSLDSCLNQTIIIEAKPELIEKSSPLALVLESSENYPYSTLGYGMDIITNYQYADDTLSRQDENQLCQKLMLDKVDVVKPNDPTILLPHLQHLE
ncbi:hypothetical protein KL935_001517 [Ogataea polymorpha]|nr:hypothetical protein KL935_001517 [Ogataea polymorpha]KAG7912764.1 hypothetical protein KL907_000966 [Ogataea polymorpha]KAG7919378.1 hypothetical protein KL927_001507 [Ogataea polymorpha]